MKDEIQESLDPQNWEEMRQLGYSMMDDAIDYLSTIRERYYAIRDGQYASEILGMVYGQRNDARCDGGFSNFCSYAECGSW